MAQNAHLAAVTHERNIFRRVIIKLLAGKRYQQASVTEHIIALKKLSNSLDDFSFNAQKIAHSAKKEIEPSDALCEGVGTVLDGPGKLMYDNGMDEEWKVLRDEARKLAERYS
jgi:hypothetical protein